MYMYILYIHISVPHQSQGRNQRVRRSREPGNGLLLKFRLFKLQALIRAQEQAGLVDCSAPELHDSTIRHLYLYEDY